MTAVVGIAFVGNHDAHALGAARILHRMGQPLAILYYFLFIGWVRLASRPAGRVTAPTRI